MKTSYTIELPNLPIPGPPTSWLRHIWKANRIADEHDEPVVFANSKSNPKHGPRNIGIPGGGGGFELYHEAIVVIRDETVLLVATTERASKILRLTESAMKLASRA